MATKRDPDISENYIHDEYTDDALNGPEYPSYQAINDVPFAPGVHTGGTLGGDAATGATLMNQGDHSFGPSDSSSVTGWDSNGNPVVQDPALRGTVAGNTNAAQALVGRPDLRDPEPTELEDDLGPEGTIVQEVGGEARH